MAQILLLPWRMGLFDIAVGPVGSFLVDQIIGEDTNEKIDSYLDDGSPAEAWQHSHGDRVNNDPTNQDTDAAAAEHYLYGRKFTDEINDEYGMPAAMGGAVLNTGLTLGYDGIKALGFGVKDYISEDAGDAMLEGLVEVTAGKEDTLPSRPTLGGTLAGIKGGFDGVGANIEEGATSLWNHFAE
jgi:hypothetical protein